MLADLQECEPQTRINGSANTWIVKPAGKSRGRGIRLFSSAQQLLAYVEQASAGMLCCAAGAV